jgi:hypothetical protein
VVRLAQIIILHRMDTGAFKVEKCLSLVKDYFEQEEQRRTFWLAFRLDRYATTGSGWPLIIDKRDVSLSKPFSASSHKLVEPGY